MEGPGLDAFVPAGGGCGGAVVVDDAELEVKKRFALLSDVYTVLTRLLLELE